MALTCAGVRGAEWLGWVAVVAVATALAPAPNGVVLAVLTNTPAGPAGGKPCPLREVTPIGVAVALALLMRCFSSYRHEAKSEGKDRDRGTRVRICKSLCV